MIRALAIIALLASAAHAKPCAGGPMFARAILGAKPRVSGSGGLIVVGDKLPDWRFRALDKLVRPDVRVLAPGLAIYHPLPQPGDEVVLETTDQNQVARAQRVFSIEPPIGPPAVARISSESNGTYTYVTAALSAAAPATARIVIVSRVVGKRTVPIAWRFASSGAGVLTLWQSPGGCSETISGWVQPEVGERVVLAWVDDAGRVSEPSKPIVISEGSKRK